MIFPAFLIENQSFIKKFEENEAEIQRIETGTSRGVAQQCLLFSMLLPVLVYPIQADVNLLGFFSVAKLLGHNGLFTRIMTENTELLMCELSPCAYGMEWDKPKHARAC